MNAKSNRILDQQQALESFFDSLLRDVEAYSQQELEAEHVADLSPVTNNKHASEPEPVSSAVQPAAVTLTARETKVEELSTPSIFTALPGVAPPEVEVEVEVEAEEVVDVEPAIPETEIVATVAPEVIAPPVAKQLDDTPPTQPDPGKPVWADSDFQAMLFKVAGLTLAVPLIDLNGVIEWDDERVTGMPGHADFYLGLMNHLGKNIPLVDTARLVLPPDKVRVLAGDNPLARLTRIVLIHNSDYGLACDEVNEVITLKPEDIRWRTSRTQRRWLAGTVIEHMCALIDATAFAELLRSRASVASFRD